MKQGKACNILHGTQVMKVKALTELFIVLFEGGTLGLDNLSMARIFSYISSKIVK